MIIELNHEDLLNAIRNHVTKDVVFPNEITLIRIKRADGGVNSDPEFKATVEVDVKDKKSSTLYR